MAKNTDKAKDISKMTPDESSPEKAGVGGSTPSRGTSHARPLLILEEIQRARDLIQRNTIRLHGLHGNRAKVRFLPGCLIRANHSSEFRAAGVSAMDRARGTATG